MTDKIENVDEWIASLYAGDNQFTVEYLGKHLTFTKRFASKIALALMNKNEEEQVFTLIAMIAIDPKLTMSQAAKLPLDLLYLIVKGMDLDPSLFGLKSEETPEKKKIPIIASKRSTSSPKS